MIPEKLTIEWLRENYKKGTVTPREVVEEIVTRAKELKEMNIFIVEPEDMDFEQYLSNLGEMDFDEKSTFFLFCIKKSAIFLSTVVNLS